MEFPNVTAQAKANVYFDGKVISHSIILADGSKKTLGLIYPGTYHFSTAAAERMEIIDGSCEVTLDGGKAPTTYLAGEQFEVPAQAGFTISTSQGICQYICSFL